MWKVAAPVVLVASLAAVPGVRPDVSTLETALEGQRSAPELLERARESLGGAKRFEAIERLRISVVEKQSRNPGADRHRTFKIWLPDRFQSAYPGLVTHTLNGDRLSIDRDLTPDARQNAEQAVPGTFRRVALAFLLTAPGLGPPKLLGETALGSLRGTLLEFPAPDGRVIRMLLDAASAQPLALMYPVRALGSPEQLPDQVWRLEDYRPVDGIRFPFRLVIAHPENELITEVQEIEVNPRFAPEDFPK